MFSLMGNCISCLKKRREPKEPITLAVLGLDCAGKTTTTKSLVGESLDEGEAPTIGFTSFKLDFGKFEITIFDLGGGRKIRGIWRNYLAEVHGVVYVVDSTAADRMEEAKETLTGIIEHPCITGKPILLLANKQDKPEALDEVDICEQLNLETLVNVHKCPTRMETVSALRGSGRKMDVNLKDGLQWLVSIIERDLELLQARVKRDMDVEKEKQRAEREARKERVRLQREERERQEAEDRKRLGLPEKAEEEEEMVGDVNPFKALDIKELEAKDRRLKEEKKRRKELELKAKEQEVPQNHGDYDGCALDSIRSDKLASLSGDATHSNSSSKYSEKWNSGGGSLSGNGAKVRLPPLMSLTGDVPEEGKKKKKKKKKRPNLEEFEDEGELLSTSVGNKSLSSLSRVELDGTVLAAQGESGGRDNLGLNIRRVEPTSSLDTPRPLPGQQSQQRKKSPRITSLEEEEDIQPSPRTLTGTSMEEESPEEESIGDAPPSSRRKKKKRRLKKNRLAPSDGQMEMNSIREPKLGMPWDQNQNNNYKKPVRREEPTGSKQTVGMGSQTWSIVSDLPEVEAEPRLRPNYDDDDDIVM